MTPAELFHRAGRALFGEQYVAPMAVLLGVEKNTVGKWRDGKSRVPPNVWNEIATLLHDRGLIDFKALEAEAIEFALASGANEPALVLSTVNDPGSTKGDHGSWSGVTAALARGTPGFCMALLS
jgi:hypothetical protein